MTHTNVKQYTIYAFTVGCGGCGDSVDNKPMFYLLVIIVISIKSLYDLLGIIVMIFRQVVALSAYNCDHCKGVGCGDTGVPVPPPHFGQKVHFLELKKVYVDMYPF